MVSHEIGEVVKVARAFFRQATASKSNHAIRRAYEYFGELEDARYGEAQEVRDFRDELKGDQS